MTQTIDINKAMREAQEYAKSLNFKTYRFMYQFGAWVSKETFASESDAEAIFDADAIFNSDEALQNWNYKVALWCGNRMVKQYR